ncbi:hypothetical protein Herbaro_18630 [Herbaspirillum sp. WKF16]|jgi:hypothetical protein|uniref:hypothetical protein n=1 Tax=Herbaspirillum sp. WKF16 TaxID=3028312 RepID=UPI0023AA0CB2|nr:hypothetical protein [Herbaspirillum sp. WKF16]WDZ95474.1 hypothetical protein Herbaro_18630 [Herbaspirillum sp. WKF16]
MMPFAKVCVPVPAAAAGMVELYINKGSRMIVRRDGAGNDWATLRASPRKVLEWFATSGFAPSGKREALAQFEPCARRLAGLDHLKTEVRPALAVPKFWQIEGAAYGFDAGPHLPYWLAKNGASFVPLLVPAEQMAHFSERLVA